MLFFKIGNEVRPEIFWYLKNFGIKEMEFNPNIDVYYDSQQDQYKSLILSTDYTYNFVLTDVLELPERINEINGLLKERSKKELDKWLDKYSPIYRKEGILYSSCYQGHCPFPISFPSFEYSQFVIDSMEFEAFNFFRVVITELVENLTPYFPDTQPKLSIYDEGLDYDYDWEFD